MGFFSGLIGPILDVAGIAGAPFTGGASLGLTALGAGIGAEQQNSDAKNAMQDQETFQANMSNSSYQRATADMKAAGLNPMLAYQNGGASTPSGASYTPQNVNSAAMSSLTDAANITNTLANAASTKAGMPLKTMENRIPDLINGVIDRLKESFGSSASSVMDNGIEAAKTGLFGGPSSAEAIGQADTGSSETRGEELNTLLNNYEQDKENGNGPTKFSHPRLHVDIHPTN